MFGIHLKVIVAMVTELCTHSISAMARCIPVLILISQRHIFSQTNNFSQIIKFGVSIGIKEKITKLVTNSNLPTD